MFPSTLDQYYLEAEELYKQAEKQRLIKSLEKSREWHLRLSNSLGTLMIEIGEQLIKRTQAAH